MHDASQVATQPAPQPAPQDAPQEAQPAKIPDGQPAGGAAAPAPTQAKAPRPAQRRRAPAAGSAVAKGDVPAFLASAPWNLDQIEQGLAAGDGAAVCRGARALASGTALVGAGTLSRQYRQLELLGRHNRLEEVRARLAQLRPEHERCLAGLGRKLAEAQ
jgi:HPt (histidine-containing phosphotransfer) domain-containing protein